MSSTADINLDSFLTTNRIITTVTESVDLTTANTIKKIVLTVNKKEITPEIFFSRSVIPYLAPTEDVNLFVSGITTSGNGLTYEYSRFFNAVSFLKNLGHQMIYDSDQLREAEFATIGYSPNGTNMYGAFKTMYDNSNILARHPQFYSLTGSNQPYAVTAFTGVTQKGSSAGTYTMVNFGGVITPFQLMYHPSNIGLTNSNGLPSATLSSPLYFGLSANNFGVTQSIKSLYFTPDLHFSVRRNLSILTDKGITYSGLFSSFNPHYQLLKNADDVYIDTQSNFISGYVGNSANPGWSVELVRNSGKTGQYLNLDGFNLCDNFSNRFFEELRAYPAKYKMNPVDFNVGQYGYPYSTSVFGWSSTIPTPGTATDINGPFGSSGASHYLNRVAGLTLYPPPITYNYLGPTGATSFGGSGGSSGWNSYHKSLTANSNYYPEYFMLGGSTKAASNTYEASKLIPANILKLFIDTNGPKSLVGTTMNFLDSYYYDIFQEQVNYGGHRKMNMFAMDFTPRFNPYIPMQIKGSFSGTTTKNYPSRRDCTIHPDMGGNTAERLYNLKNSIRDSVHSAIKMWKLVLDSNGKFNYRIMPVVSGRSEDFDLTRGGSVPFTPEDFVEYIVKPMFDGPVKANGFIMNTDIDSLLLNGFYYGNIARGSNEYTKVVTNAGISGTDKTTAFIRGLETYFFDLEALQYIMTSDEYAEFFGMTAASTDFNSYLSIFNSGRFTDYRVYETNIGLTGGNTKIPYGFNGTFRWYQVPLNKKSIMYTDTTLRDRWTDSTNDNIRTSYSILRDAFFELTKQQLNKTNDYFNTNKITTLVDYNVNEVSVGR